MFCRNCGKEIDNKAFICPHCGILITSDVAATQTTTKSASSNDKIKNGLNIAANVCAIVFMAFLLFASLIMLSLFGFAGAVGDNGYGMLTLYGMIFSIVIFPLMAVSIVTIIMAALAIAKGKGNKGKGFKITVIVMLAIIVLLYFCGGGYLYALLNLVPIGLEIAALCIKVDDAPATTPAYSQSTYGQPAYPTYPSYAAPVTPAAQSREQKLAELQRLRELNVISAEQYANALEALNNNLSK